MKETLEFVLRHGYLILFLSVLVEQMGLPLPSIPILLAIGALSASGAFVYPVALLFAVTASLIADSIWYWMGVYRGSAILKLLCKISLEPDSCVRRTENMFVRYGAPGLLFSKFLPGLSTAAAPLAGMFRMNILKFTLADGLGALIWATAYSGLGYVFHDQLEDLAEHAAKTGSRLAGLIIVGVASYLAWKYIERRRFYRELRIARITPEELRLMLDRGETVTVIDLRNALEWSEDGALKLPGAMNITFEELENRMHEIPTDRDVILYCT
ncbi:MAG: hypothetical protein JWO80_5282 [Bryobacterales bacterium]|nr:hypothetical protein [Bryobacterales bacterium]